MKTISERDEDEMMTVGEAARFLSASISTMRRWDAEGLLQPTGRTPGGHRRYRKRQLIEFGNHRRRVLADAIAPPYQAEVTVTDVARLMGEEPWQVALKYGPVVDRGGCAWVKRDRVVGLVLGCPLGPAREGRLVTEHNATEQMVRECERRMLGLTLVTTEPHGLAARVYDAMVRRSLHSGHFRAMMIPLAASLDPGVLELFVHCSRDFGVRLELMPKD